MQQVAMIVSMVFSRRHAKRAKLAIVFCRAQGNFPSAEFYDRQRGQEFLDAVEVAVPIEARAAPPSRALCARFRAPNPDKQCVISARHGRACRGHPRDDAMRM
jgi:hypothetical protein